MKLEKKIEAIWVILLMGVLWAWLYTLKLGDLPYFHVEDIYDFWKIIQSLGYLISALIFGTLLIMHSFSSKIVFTISWTLFLIFLIGAGEESNWGQLWFDFESPAFFKMFNWEEKTNFHDIFIGDFDVNRYVKIVLKIFIVLYAGLLPLLYHISGSVQRSLEKYSVLVVPLSFVPFVFIGVLIDRHFIMIPLHDIVGSKSLGNSQEAIKTMFSFIILGTVLLYAVKSEKKDEYIT